MSIRIAIVEDNEEILRILRRIVDRAPELTCVCTAGSGEGALSLIPPLQPDVVIMDLRLPGMSGVECITRLKSLQPDLQIVVYTVHNNNEQVFQALQAGASGYILKRSTHAEILQAVLDVASGGAPMTGEIARKVVQSMWRKETSEPQSTDALTKREEEILGLLARGFVTKEIADHLSISIETVRFHVKNIYSKLHVRSRTEAVVKYLK